MPWYCCWINAVLNRGRYTRLIFLYFHSRSGGGLDSDPAALNVTAHILRSKNRAFLIISTQPTASQVSIIIIIIIIIIGTTAPFEPRPSSEASASCLYSLQHTSNFYPPTSWHLPSHHLPILVTACPFLSSSFYHCNEKSSCMALFFHTNNMSCPF